MTNIKRFAKICRFEQKELKDYISSVLTTEYGKDRIVNKDGYIYAKGSVPIMLVAHMDTVHEDCPKEIFIEKETSIISSPQGIGGDDRCGVYMILDIIKTHRCSVLFCEDEEVGGVGAEKFCHDFAGKDIAKFIIEFDRKGNNDAVFYDCGNKEFKDFITKEYFDEAFGTFSDISIIAPEFDLAAVNLSCGYYKAHTKDEYVVLDEMEEVIRQAKKIIDRADSEKSYDFQSTYHPTYDWLDNGWYDGTSWYKTSSKSTSELKSFWIEYDDAGVVLQDEYAAINEFEAMGMFFSEHIMLCYNDIIDIFEERY